MLDDAALRAASDLDEQQPTLLERFFASGNWLVRSGIVVLFLGVGFLLKFAADHSLLPIEFRLAGFGISGISLVLLGLKLTAARRAPRVRIRFARWRRWLDLFDPLRRIRLVCAAQC